MEKRYPGDFVRCRPWGRAGDRKCDGYLKSQRTLFQVYAPNELKGAKTVAKIRDDFKGALPYWRDYFDKWVFVHNSRGGLAPEVIKTLNDLPGTEPIQVSHWGFEELRQEVFQLAEAESVIPSRSGHRVQRDLMDVGFEDLGVVLEAIAGPAPSDLTKVRIVNGKKIERNRLSDSVGEFLKAGMAKADRVSQFFQRYHDPTFGDRVAGAFKRQYLRLRDSGYWADEIFHSLQVFAGGERVPDGGTPMRCARSTSHTCSRSAKSSRGGQETLSHDPAHEAPA